MKKILCVHQGYELYGSDRMFILSLKAIRKTNIFGNITVHLPKKGDLYDHLVNENLVDDIIIKPLAVLRKSDLKKLRFGILVNSLFNLRKTVKFCNTFDVVYINSIVVVDYLLASKFIYGNKKVITHIHELPYNDFVASVFQRLILFSRSYSFFISEAVRKRFNKLRGSVIINGIKGFEYNKNITFGGGLRILHIGRINSFKGQGFLLKSLIYILKNVDNNFKFKLRIIGSVFEDQKFYLDELRKIVEDEELDNYVEFIDFNQNPEIHFHWANVVVVSSTSPEPFGLVAVEALSAGPIVIAAEHGGLSEIFEHKISGLYFTPNNINSLVEALLYVRENPLDCEKMSVNGRKLFDKMYTEDAYINRFVKVFIDIVKKIQVHKLNNEVSNIRYKGNTK